VSNKSSAAGPQDLSPGVANACRAITAFLTKLEHTADKIVQYKCSIAQHIAEIRRQRPNDWLQVVEAECGLGRRRAYSFLALVNGTETIEGQRAANAAANKRLRDRQRASRDAQNSPRPDLQAHIDELEAAREHDRGLAERLRLAETKIAGLEGEIAALKAENATLRAKLEATQGAPAENNGSTFLRDGRPMTADPRKEGIPPFLRVQNREPPAPEASPPVARAGSQNGGRRRTNGAHHRSK